MVSVWKFVVGKLEKGFTVFLATLIERVGSSPRSVGSKMAVSSDGDAFGSIGGGSLEAFVAEKLVSFGKSGRLPCVLDYSMEAERLKNGMACGGRVRLLLEEIKPSHLGLYREVLAALKERSPCYLVKRLPPESGVKLTYTKPEDRDGVFVDVVLPQERLVVFGAGHIAFYLSKLASLCGFDVFVYDDRPDYAVKERFPEAVSIDIVDFGDVSHLVTDGDYVVIATSSNLSDKRALSSVLKSRPGFIGLVGSKRKFGKIVDELVEEGFDRELILGVRCPVGIDIGAETPCEIAVSIVSELIRFRRSFHGLSDCQDEEA